MHIHKKEYNPIEDYGIIGDLNTVALVSLQGSIDFMCFPNFDSPSLFAAMLDKNKGGFFQIAPLKNNIKDRQLYIPETNVLLTRFHSDDGVSELTDFMHVDLHSKGNILIRRITNIMGKDKYQVTCAPRFNYALTEHKVEKVSSKEILFFADGSGEYAVRLLSSIDLELSGKDVYTEFELEQGASAEFIFQFLDSTQKPEEDISTYINQKLTETINYWKQWSDISRYQGRWREMINRSALVLKLLISNKYGSIIASPTFSLPEYVGGDRNWDYRYIWIRDASFTIYTLLNLGYRKEATAFIKWIEKECEDLSNAGRLSLMYTVMGENVSDEKVLDHLEGYKGSKPVRIGNNAKNQVQLDIYGELMDSIYLYSKYVEPISFRLWKDLERQINWLSKNWQRKDEGIWEVRGGQREFLYSRLLCWVALDRGIKVANMRSLPLNQDWIIQRNNIFNSIFEDFWNEDIQSFVQYKGSDTVDAATLLMPLMRFIGPKDPMWISTLKKIEEELVSDALVFRYRHKEAADDGLKVGEGTFSMCTFWYIECLAKSGQLEKARLYFEKMLGYSNHLGLFAEQLGFKGEHLGNYPQAFTHLGLISAALQLNKSLNDKRNEGKIIRS